MSVTVYCRRCPAQIAVAELLILEEERDHGGDLNYKIAAAIVCPECEHQHFARAWFLAVETTEESK